MRVGHEGFAKDSVSGLKSHKGPNTTQIIAGPRPCYLGPWTLREGHGACTI